MGFQGNVFTFRIIVTFTIDEETRFEETVFLAGSSGKE